MRIAIDIQGLQSESRFRGIGRYTRAIIKSLISLSFIKKYEVILIGNGAFPVKEILNEFAPIVGRRAIKFWYPPGDCAFEQPVNHHNNKNAKIVREAFFKSLKPDVIYVPTMFEGYQDNSVLSVNEFDKETPVVTTLYDLIPLHNPEQYLDPNPNYKKFYLEKISYLQACKKLLAISDFSMKEGQEYFKDKANDIINVSTACDDIFRVVSLNDEEVNQLKVKFKITKPFIMYSGGADERKNLPALIKALSELPGTLRETYDFVLAGKLSQFDIDNLNHYARKYKLEHMSMVMTGYVSDEELVRLYNMCSLFVFPSWHEGFGLPALEALACGAVVIGADNTSLPEVIGIEEALFDPYSVADIREKITHVLTNQALYRTLKEKGLARAQIFSWKNSAEVALAAIEEVVRKRPKCSPINADTPRKKLAFFTPLSPARSGISLYSEELLPALSKFYDIDVVIDENQSDINENSLYSVIKVNEFLNAAECYERIIYQMGNSVFHDYMHEILEIYPGIVCLHDFYLSNYFRYKETLAGNERHWSDQLLSSHGYKSIIHRAEVCDDDRIMYHYPSNFNVLSNAIAIIVHSDYSRKLAKQWYYNSRVLDWERIPLLRATPHPLDKNQVRNELNISDNTILICSFGMLDSSKLNHMLIEALGALPKKSKDKIKMVFVGELGGDYKITIESLIKTHQLEDVIEVTGWASDALYRQYLAAADIGVQLRCLSRGETSAAVLDCMNYGLATIVNANGSMAELPDDKVIKLDDDFLISDLIESIDKLCNDKEYRSALGKDAHLYVASEHSPEVCAESCFNHIEAAYNKINVTVNDVIKKLEINNDEVKRYANLIANNFPRLKSTRKIFFDVSLIKDSDLWTGIERVTRALLIEMIKLSNNHFSVVPVYLSKELDGYILREANGFMQKLYPGIASYVEGDRCVDLHEDDIYFSSELACDLVIDVKKNGFYEHLLKKSVNITFMIHDILPVTKKDFFPPGANENFSTWLNIVIEYSDKIICVTDAVVNEVNKYINNNNLSNPRLQMGYSHHGADILSTIPSAGTNSHDLDKVSAIKQNLSFLMVGTVEPRKGHLQAIAAFDRLWASDNESSLVIVGKEGWKGLPDNARRTIPEIVHTIKNHPLLGKKLFWFDNASDELLSELYANADCLLYPSEDEGFGLPLIEASQHNKPLIARDIPVLREVAGEGAYYFKSNRPEALSHAVEEWIELFKKNAHPDSANISWLTWAQSAENLVKKLFD
ncbi:glycosyltransferase [Pantoea dispersa]